VLRWVGLGWFGLGWVMLLLVGLIPSTLGCVRCLGIFSVCSVPSSMILLLPPLRIFKALPARGIGTNIEPPT